MRSDDDSEGPPELIENSEDSSGSDGESSSSGPSWEVDEARAALTDFCQHCKPGPPADHMRSAIQPAWTKHKQVVDAICVNRGDRLATWKCTAEICFWMAVLWARNMDLVVLLAELFR